MSMILRRRSDITAENIGYILNKNGYCNLSTVTGLSITDSYPYGDDEILFHLHLCCNEDASDQLPRNVLVKIGNPVHRHHNAEVVFYRSVAPLLQTNAPILQCFDAAYDPEYAQYHLLLSDRIQSHRSCADTFLQPLSFDQLTPLVSSVAQIHLQMWDHPDLLTLAKPPSSEQLKRWLGSIESMVKKEVDFSDPRLPEKTGEIFSESIHTIASGAPDRFDQQKNLTITHGNLSAEKVLVPRIGDSFSALMQQPAENYAIVDWHYWGIGLAPIDCAQLICYHMAPSEQKEKAFELMHLHHSHLLQRAENTYDFNQYLGDFWLCLQRIALEAIWNISDDLLHPNYFDCLQRAVECYTSLRPLFLRELSL